MRLLQDRVVLLLHNDVLTMKYRRWSSLGILFLTLTAGCSSGTISPPPPPKTSEDASPIATPFRLTVEEEVIQGGVLSLRVQLIGEVAWDPDEVLIRLTPYQDGEATKEIVFERVGALISRPLGSRVIEPLIPLSLLLSADVGSSTDYQVEIKWGLSNKLVKTHEHDVIHYSMTSTTMIPSECPQESVDCHQKYQVKGYLTNQGTSSVESVLLGVSFGVRGGAAESGKESRIRISNLHLSPGAQREVSILIPQPQGVTFQNDLIPKVRLLTGPTISSLLKDN
jgi:hypothetical protein